MPFNRVLLPTTTSTSDELTSAMAGLGMNFHAEPNYYANFEDTVFYASVDGVERRDLRTLSVLTTWLESYARWLIPERLRVLVENHHSTRLRAFWSAVGRWQAKDRRYQRLARFHRGRRVDLLDTGTEFHLSRHGEDPRFEGTPLRVPANVLRRRPTDVAPPDWLQKWNPCLRYRILIGPSYRADMWAELDANSQLTPAQLAARTYGSYPTAWYVKRDWELLRAA